MGNKSGSSAGSKDKKRKKDEVENRDNGKLRRTGTPVDLLVGRPSAPSAVAVESDDSSGASNTATWAGQSTGTKSSAHTHRTMRPGSSALKKKKSKSAPKEGRLAFVSEHTLVRETSIVSFRYCGEKLWVTNPEANVMCEVCMKRLPQQGGRLSGGTGFMSHQSFHCHKCSANIEDDDESDE